MALDIAKVKAEVNGLLNGSDSVQIDMADPLYAELVAELFKAKVRLDLTKETITVDFPKSGSTTLVLRRITTKGGATLNQTASPSATKPPEKMAKAPNPTPPIKRHQHSYVVPKIAGDFLDIMRDNASHVIWLTGPTQCGKDRLVHYAGRELGRKVYQINCKGDMDSAVFFGEKTIVVDENSNQNKIVFQMGQVEQACREGTDVQGNEIGPPGILFITEAAAMPARIAIGINRFLESDDTRRTLVIDTDGGRVVRSHSGLRIVFASNTVGRGATSMESSAYSAQTDALDISLLNRIAVCFRMGYNKDVERHILAEKIGDDRVANMVLKFRDAIRQNIREGKLTSPFSTAHIVH
ncbi:MAG: hypothetical protein ABFD50_11515, partial [Smithella sp.]